MALDIYVETRPKLKVCNIFIKLSEPVDSCTVDVEESEISIFIKDKPFRALLPLCIKMTPKGISGFAHQNESTTFRTQIKDFHVNPSSAEKVVSYNPGVRSGEDVTLFCGCCHRTLCEPLRFERVLPLPSSEDMNDFFCHDHSDNTRSLEPRAADFFFNFFFCKINSKNLPTNTKDNKYVCPHCSTHLGEVSVESVKLWNCCISLNSEPAPPESSVQSFLRSFTCFMTDLPSLMNKVVLIFNEEENRKEYTLLWILERDLTLLTGSQSLAQETLQLEPQKVFKVLYSHHTDKSPVVEEWLDSFNSSTIHVPSLIKKPLLSYLELMTDRIPENSRRVNDFVVSYVSVIQKNVVCPIIAA